MLWPKQDSLEAVLWHTGDVIFRQSVVSGARYMALGFEFAGIVVAAVIGGYYIDQRLGTAPLFMLLLTAGGVFGAIKRLLWSLKKTS